MDQWIGSFLNWVSGGVSTLARWVAGALAYLWNTITAALSSAAWNLANLANIFGNFVAGWERILSAVYWKIVYIFRQLVPAALQQAFAWATQFAQWALNEAVNFAISAVTTLRNWAIEAINYTINLINILRQVIFAQIAQIVNLLNTVAKRVFDLLTDPTVLAQWLIGALWGVAWKYIYDRRLSLSQYLMRSAVSLTLFIAKTLEEIIITIL